MAETRSDQMVNRLRDLQATAPDIIASAVVTADGLSLASALPSNVEEERVAAMSAAMLSLGERIAQELQRGSMEEVYIRGDQCLVLLTAVGRDAVLTALSRSEAKLGLMFLEMRRAAADLEQYVA
jgi:predicted regulator of Ras-like GTPase activity (Roadblock/LC7/MglB family)